MDKQVATKLVAIKLAIAEHALKEACKIADEAGISFTFNLGGADNVNRDIAGSYYGKGMRLDEDDLYEVRGEYMSSDHIDELEDEFDDYGDPIHVLNRGAWSAWTSSSELC